MRPQTPQRVSSEGGEAVTTNHHSRTRSGGSARGFRPHAPRDSSGQLLTVQMRTTPRQGNTETPVRTRAPSQSSSAAGPSTYRAASRESSKENMAPADAEAYETQRRRIEELKAEVGTLRYQVNTFEQEREMARLQHEAELREARRKAEDDFKQRQAAEAERAAATRQLAAVQGELASARGDEDARQTERARQLREAQDAARALQEQLEDAAAMQADERRRLAKRAAELEEQAAAAQRRAEERTQAAEAATAELQRAQAAAAEHETQTGALEAEVLRLKAQTGDAATMEIIRRELKDQVSHIRTLEATNREQLLELRHLRQTHKAVEIVEEEKRTLLRRLDAAEALERELAEERLQRQRLETEHRAWAAYLPDDADFDSPEDVAKALMEERYRTAELTERIGAVEADLAQRDADIRQLQAQKAELARVQATATTTAAPTTTGDKIRARLERQRALAVKEVEYLRAQLRAFDAEDETFRPDQFDQPRADRVQELEKLVDEYRAEVQSLQAELAKADAPEHPADPPTRKRPHDDDDDEVQAGQLARKTRALQAELAAARTAQRGLETELAVAREQLGAAQTAVGVRILSLRSNPTADHQAVQQATLTALQTENAELLAHVQGTGSFTTVPLSVLAAAQREIAAAQAEAASARKAAKRLKEVWASKSAEFKEAVESTLGWHVAFMPNGKMRMESAFLPSATDAHEHALVFDGERGTMKVGGGPRSPFAQRIADQIRFWVRDKGCIPGFLAALTLEFCEEATGR